MSTPCSSLSACTSSVGLRAPRSSFRPGNWRVGIPFAAANCIPPQEGELLTTTYEGHQTASIFITAQMVLRKKHDAFMSIASFSQQVSPSEEIVNVCQHHESASSDLHTSYATGFVYMQCGRMTNMLRSYLLWRLLDKGHLKVMLLQKRRVVMLTSMEADSLPSTVAA